MEPDQGEARQIVVDRSGPPPALLGVAALASCAQPPLVRIIALVTRVAVGFQLICIEITSVAAITGQLAMLPTQWESGRFVVLEPDGSPFIGYVAGSALGAISAAMGILKPVTSDAGSIDSLPVLQSVASLASDALVCAD